MALVGWWRWNVLQKKFLLLILVSQTSSLPYDDVRGFLFFPRTFTKCVYTRVPPRFVVWTSSGRNLLFEFYFTKNYYRIRTHVAKNWSSCYDTKIFVQSFSFVGFKTSWFFLTMRRKKHKRISLLLCRSKMQFSRYTWLVIAKNA